MQGICADEEAISWSFTTTLAKTDMIRQLLRKVPVANHHGDLCFHDGHLDVAVNLGRFNDPEGSADAWVYAHDADTLNEVARHEVQEVFHPASGSPPTTKKWSCRKPIPPAGLNLVGRGDRK